MCSNLLKLTSNYKWLYKGFQPKKKHTHTRAHAHTHTHIHIHACRLPRQVIEKASNDKLVEEIILLTHKVRDLLRTFELLRAARMSVPSNTAVQIIDSNLRGRW
jgi:hypothetical protein